METALRELLQGATGWVTTLTALVGALTAFGKAFSPLFNEIRIWWKSRNRPKPPLPLGPSVPELRVRWKPLVAGLILLFVSAVGFDYVTKPQLISVSEERTNAAWAWFKKGEPDPIRNRPAETEALRLSIRIADAVVADLKGAADVRQNALVRSSEVVPPTGEVSREQRRGIWALGPLNDVATCLWIRARALQHLKQTNDAVVAFTMLTNYTHARTWDPRGLFWSPSEDAYGRLETIAQGTPLLGEGVAQPPQRRP